MPRLKRFNGRQSQMKTILRRIMSYELAGAQAEAEKTYKEYERLTSKSK